MTIRPLIPYILIIASGVIWGATFSLTLIATRDGASPILLATFQAIICSILFALIAKTINVPVFRWKNIKVYIFLAGIGIITPNLLYFNAAPHLSAGILSITVSTVPMLTYGLMWGLKIEGFSPKRMLGIVLGMVAILLLILPDQGLQSSDTSLWTLVVLICAMCYAAENVYIDFKPPPSMSVVEMLGGSNIIASIVLIPILLSQENIPASSWFVGASAMALFGIALCSTAAYMMFFKTIQMSGAVFASQCAYIVTLSGVAWGVLLFSEQITIWLWLSIFAMLIGLALVQPMKKDRKETE